MRRATILRFVTLLLGLGCAPAPAFAYIDPGTGSLLVQGLLGAIAVGLAFGRTLWSRVKAFFTRGRRNIEDPRRDSYR